MLHGGYWQAIHNLTHAGHLCVDLTAHGVATWNVEYRRLGDPGGGWPGTFDDVEAALAFFPSSPRATRSTLAASRSPGTPPAVTSRSGPLRGPTFRSPASSRSPAWSTSRRRTAGATTTA